MRRFQQISLHRTPPAVSVKSLTVPEESDNVMKEMYTIVLSVVIEYLYHYKHSHVHLQHATSQVIMTILWQVITGSSLCHLETVAMIVMKKWHSPSPAEVAVISTTARTATINTCHVDLLLGTRMCQQYWSHQMKYQPLWKYWITYHVVIVWTWQEVNSGPLPPCGHLYFQ